MDPILFDSTNRKAEKIPFDRAMLGGLAPDRGLYMPDTIPKIPIDEIRSFSGMTYSEIAFQVIRPFVEGCIPRNDFASILNEVYDFDVPLEPVRNRTFVMRLDRGPTASFKDFAARLMGRLMQYFIGRENRPLLILTATSGDTGSAIASAFHGLDHIRVVVLFPEGEVTARQRRQMTTLGGNVRILALDAKFDDCQALVKRAFSDPDLAGLNLSSANSINIGRLLPQTVYYFYAFARLHSDQNSDDVVFSVPSGNFGDMMGGLLA